MTDERAIILETLLLIRKSEDFSNRIIKDVLDRYDYLDRSHRSFIKRIAEGCVERRIELDYIIDAFSKTPTRKMKPVILCILEMGVYQLKYMDAVPASAICNEAVRLTEKKGFRTLKGFVNGVLRNIARGEDPIRRLLASQTASAAEKLSIRYSMPLPLTEHFLTYYPEKTEEILAAFLRQAAPVIRVNRARTTVQGLRDALAEDGASIEEVPPIDALADCAAFTARGVSVVQEQAYVLQGYDRIDGLDAYADGLFQVQDAAAMQAVALAGIRNTDVVFDVCAAPGGKTIQAADRLQVLCDASENAELCKQNTVFSFDLTEKKTNLIREHVKRCQYTNISIAEADARIRNDNYVNQADVLIADLPCSGLGIIGRKSDIKYRVTPDSMRELVQLQREILKNVAAYVKEGGVLIYATCTLNPKENEEQSVWIVQHLPFRQLAEVCILPNETHDGFYFSKFLKISHP